MLRYFENALLLLTGRTRIPLPSLSNRSLSPLRTPSTRRISRGTVICPLLVIVACFCIAHSVFLTLPHLPYSYEAERGTSGSFLHGSITPSPSGGTLAGIAIDFCQPQMSLSKALRNWVAQGKYLNVWREQQQRKAQPGAIGWRLDVPTNPVPAWCPTARYRFGSSALVA